jgi:hypothetical protein
MFSKIPLNQGHKMVTHDFTLQEFKRKTGTRFNWNFRHFVREAGLALLHHAALSNAFHLQLID